MQIWSCIEMKNLIAAQSVILRLFYWGPPWRSREALLNSLRCNRPGASLLSALLWLQGDLPVQHVGHTHQHSQRIIDWSCVLYITVSLWLNDTKQTHTGEAGPIVLVFTGEQPVVSKATRWKLSSESASLKMLRERTTTSRAGNVLRAAIFYPNRMPHEEDTILT